LWYLVELRSVEAETMLNSDLADVETGLCWNCTKLNKNRGGIFCHNSQAVRHHVLAKIDPQQVDLFGGNACQPSADHGFQPSAGEKLNFILSFYLIPVVYKYGLQDPIHPSPDIHLRPDLSSA